MTKSNLQPVDTIEKAYSIYEEYNPSVNKNTHTVPLISSQRYEFAHMLRGIAAIIVVFGAHLMAFGFNPNVASQLIGVEPITEQIRIPSGISIFYSFQWINYGYFGVALFFLISGFVIPFSLSRLAPKQFLIARFFRIYPTYWIGLTISLMVIKLMNEEGTWAHWFHIPAQYTLLRGMVGGPMLDGISWTLEIELEFYFVCALFANIVSQGKNVKLMLLVFACGVCLFLPFFANFVPLFTSGYLKIHFPLVKIINSIGFSLMFIPYMLIGTLFNWHCRKLIPNQQFLFLICITFIWFSFLWSQNPKTYQHIDGTRDYLLALLVFSLVYTQRNSIIIPNFLKWFGDISYPLYVVHPIVGYGMLYYLIYSINLDPWIALILTSLMVLFLANLIHKMIELPSNVWGKKIARSFQ